MIVEGLGHGRAAAAGRRDDGRGVPLHPPPRQGRSPSSSAPRTPPRAARTRPTCPPSRASRDEKKIRCDKCGRVIPPWSEICPACLLAAQGAQPADWTSSSPTSGRRPSGFGLAILVHGRPADPPVPDQADARQRPGPGQGRGQADYAAAAEVRGPAGGPDALRRRRRGRPRAAHGARWARGSAATSATAPTSTCTSSA